MKKILAFSAAAAAGYGICTLWTATAAPDKTYGDLLDELEREMEFFGASTEQKREVLGGFADMEGTTAEAVARRAVVALLWYSRKDRYRG